MKRLLFLMLLVALFYIPGVSAMEVKIQKPDTEILVLELESSDTIEFVKDKIFDADNDFIPELQILYHNDVELIDGRTLADYEVQADSIIYLSLKKFKVEFNANGGKFGDNETYLVDWDDNSYDNLVEPSRNGYYFTGYYTEKSGGTKLELILAESGIDSDMTFYE